MQIKAIYFGLSLLAVLALGIGAGWWLQSTRTAPTPVAKAQPAERKVLYYRNPMDPSIHSDHPMQDNMGMDYIPVYADQAAPQADDVLHINPKVLQNLGLRTTQVRRARLGQTMQSNALIALNEHAVTTINPKISGWVEQLQVRAVGDVVKRGQVLAQIYSPELLRAQEDYLIALRALDNPHSGEALQADNQALLGAVRQRLRRLDFPESAIAALQQSGLTRRTVPVIAPYSGVVTEITLREGGRVQPDMPLLSLADLSQVWAEVQLYPDQIARVGVGDPVQLTLPAFPGRVWRGRLEYIYPAAEADSRVMRARLTLANPGGLLRPGMLAQAQMGRASSRLALVLPREAVIRHGEQSLVMLSLAAGQLQPVEVRTGEESGELVEILSGLEAGQTVVSSGQFLLDAEASMKGALQRMAGHGHD